MNDTARQPSIHPSNPQSQGTSGVVKESEPIVTNVTAELSQITEIGREAELSPDVSAAGVSVHPTVVTIPAPLEAHGVQQAGANVVLGTGETVSLPLTDKEIITGLKQPASNSIKFLALWCKRKLQQIGRAIQTIGGKSVEVETL